MFDLAHIFILFPGTLRRMSDNRGNSCIFFVGLFQMSGVNESSERVSLESREEVT